MLHTAIKVLLTAVLVIAISEVAKRSSAVGGVIASLPLTSLLAFVWLYGETGDVSKVAALSSSILWFTLPSLVLFVVLPILLGRGIGFWPSLLGASTATFGAYCVMTAILSRS
ncbi:DUF3147 family protein [Hyphomicrobium sp.]|uniref:DUF3147 family protein n=1 Tax=Hyphomicrobium sp. TaxID=82 RepID=UPI002B812713|nr:DUF3147 family protein [Hyphomicrobium sp.]HVZ06135.1 DUF3147 family protein [Hyphomicrobium sp.]